MSLSTSCADKSKNLVAKTNAQNKVQNNMPKNNTNLQIHEHRVRQRHFLIIVAINYKIFSSNRVAVSPAKAEQ